MNPPIIIATGDGTCQSHPPYTFITKNGTSPHSAPMMEEQFPDPSRLPVYTMQLSCDYTLDDRQLAKRCPLDNGRHTSILAPPRYSVGQLDKLPAEVLTRVLVRLDMPSLTHFRRVNRRTMEIVDSTPQYAAVIKHCPNIIRATVSLQADAFDCHTLYATLNTARCSTCDHFGYYLYLIDCRRVCYHCFTRRLGYFPLTIDLAATILSVNDTQQGGPTTNRQRLLTTKFPSVLSLPGRYCKSRNGDEGILMPERLQLLDRQAVVQDLAVTVVPNVDKTAREPL